LRGFEYLYNRPRAVQTRPRRGQAFGWTFAKNKKNWKKRRNGLFLQKAVLPEFTL
jgi:hypothetical protein